MHAVVVAVPRRALFSVTVKLRVVRQETQDFRAAQAPEVLARTSPHARLLELLEVLARWVSKKPTDRKNGSGGGWPRISLATGATLSTWLVSILTTRSKPDDVRTLGDVLLADQHGVVARIVKRVDEVLAVVVQ